MYTHCPLPSIHSKPRLRGSMYTHFPLPSIHSKPIISVHSMCTHFPLPSIHSKPKFRVHSVCTHFPLPSIPSVYTHPKNCPWMLTAAVVRDHSGGKGSLWAAMEQKRKFAPEIPLRSRLMTVRIGQIEDFWETHYYPKKQEVEDDSDFRLQEVLPEAVANRLFVPPGDAAESSAENRREAPETRNEEAAVSKSTFKPDAIYFLHFKGILSHERIVGSNSYLLGIGTVINDGWNNCLWAQKKCLFTRNFDQQEAEIISLQISLQNAIDLGINRINICCDYYPIYQFVKRGWAPRKRHHAYLMEHASNLIKKFECFQVMLLRQNDLRSANELAKEAVTSISKQETCLICLEDVDLQQVFSIGACFHHFCFSCMRLYVELKLRHGIVPICPHEGWDLKLDVDACRCFLPLNLVERWKDMVKEGSIPIEDRLYCPYSTCSTVMSTKEAFENSRNLIGSTISRVRRCITCRRLFCLSCKSPWHTFVSCRDYQQLPGERQQLVLLANHNRWRSCVKCQNIIELTGGCMHVTCRCGCEFCYNCGAEWKNKAPTCSCFL